MDSSLQAYKMTELCELMMKVRDYVNEPKLRDALFSNGRVWNMVCSSMDAIEDTDLAAEAYLKIIKEHYTHDEHYSFDKGYSYLLCSGAMQTLFVQRDAVVALCECLKIDYDEDHYPELREIREIRNASIGHPTNWRKKHSVHIIQHSLGISGFEMWVFSNDHSYETTMVSVPQLIAAQRKFLANIINGIIYELQQRERQHREKFKDVKLSEILSPNMHYFFEKIYQATQPIQRREDVVLGIAALKTLVGELAKVEQELGNRDIKMDTYDSIGPIYKYLEYPICKLESYYQCIMNNQVSEIDSNTAYIMAFFVCEHIKKLKAHLQEIDEMYDSEP